MNSADREAFGQVLAENRRLKAEIARLTAALAKPRPHVVQPAVDHFGHIRCVSCGHSHDQHLPTCFQHERLKRDGKVVEPTEGGQP